jgi:5'-3' exonuclease
MIIVDLNQTMLANLHMQIGNHTNIDLDENMIRHMVLNAIRSYKQKFGNEYGDICIACDNTNIWRKKVFPYYKANRKKAIEKSELDWKQIFQIMGNIRQELKDYFPYKVVDIESCEADDVIATLCKNSDESKILILSGDKDFIQLHNERVKQYDPTRKKWIQHDNPHKYLMQHILKGDSGDGIPNVLSNDNCFVVGERQKPLREKKIEELVELDISTKFDHSLFRNYQRNRQLIDLSQTPKDLQEAITTSFTNQEGKTREKLLDYFIKFKLKHLMEHISEF